MLQRTVVWIALIVLVAGVGACQKSLFPEGTPRSPYERYGGLRGELRPETTVDAYGREQPALRERLRPLDRP